MYDISPTNDHRNVAIFTLVAVAFNMLAIYNVTVNTASGIPH